METRICPQCGKQIPADAITCKFCGTLFFASPNELEGERSLQSAYNKSFGEGSGEYYENDTVEYDENGGYYDEEGNYHEGVRFDREEPKDISFAVPDIRPQVDDNYAEDISDEFLYTEDGDVDNSAPDFGPDTEMKFRKTLIIALTVIVLLLLFLVVVIINSKSNLSGFSKKYDVSRSYTNYVPATVPGDSDMDSDHMSDSDETVGDEDSLPEALIPDSIPQPDSSSTEETTTETTSMPDEVIPESTTPSSTTPTETEPPDTTPSDTQPPDTTPSQPTPPEDDSSEGGLVIPDDSSEPDESTDDSSEVSEE